MDIIALTGMGKKTVYCIIILKKFGRIEKSLGMKKRTLKPIQELELNNP